MTKEVVYSALMKKLIENKSRQRFALIRYDSKSFSIQKHTYTYTFIKQYFMIIDRSKISEKGCYFFKIPVVFCILYGYILLFALLSR